MVLTKFILSLNSGRDLCYAANASVFDVFMPLKLAVIYLLQYFIILLGSRCFSAFTVLLGYQEALSSQ